MLSICSWRFDHVSTDIGKLRLSSILALLQEWPMSFTLKFTKQSALHSTLRSFREEFCIILDYLEMNCRDTCAAALGDPK